MPPFLSDCGHCPDAIPDLPGIPLPQHRQKWGHSHRISCKPYSFLFVPKIDLRRLQHRFYGNFLCTQSEDNKSRCAVQPTPIFMIRWWAAAHGGFVLELSSGLTSMSTATRLPWQGVITGASRPTTPADSSRMMSLKVPLALLAA